MMKPNTITSLWRMPLCLVACVAGSLATVWVVSTVAGFSFHSSVVVVLSSATCAAAIAHHVWSKCE